MNKDPISVSDQEFNQVLENIRARHPRRWWDLSFKENDLETAFMTYYAARTLDNNIFVTQVGAAALSLFSVILWMATARPVWLWTFPSLLGGSIFLIAIFLMLKYGLPLFPKLQRFHYHIVGLASLLTLCNILMLVEWSFCQQSLTGYDAAIFDSKIRHTFVITLYMATTGLYSGLHWSLFGAAASVIGNFLTLTLGLGSHLTAYTSTIAAYSMSAATALIEAYLLQKKMRDVFLMERIVSDTQAAKPGAIQLEQTSDLIENIRRARMRRVGDSQADDSGAVRPWHDIHLSGDLEDNERSLPGHEPESLPQRPSSSTFERPTNTTTSLEPRKSAVSRAAARSTKTAKRCLKCSGLSKLPHVVRSYARRFWKRIYLVWPDSFHENNYLQWQDRHFSRVYRIATALQCVSLGTHIYLDKKSFCKPAIRGQQSAFLCVDSAAVVRRTYIFFFVPVLFIAIIVSFGPFFKVHPSTSHRCALAVFAALFAGYTTLTIQAARNWNTYEGMAYPENAYEIFDTYAFNVLIAAGGGSGLPSHLFMGLLAFALVFEVGGLAFGLPLQIAAYDIVLLFALAATAGTLVSDGERLARRHHALRGLFIDKCRDGLKI
ncbi:hypothetical protein HDU88_006778 [Geranomyces variabilis]|nr:hypothetical protein HDU88_006778 [Geranomyces variabilis]